MQGVLVIPGRYVQPRSMGHARLGQQTPRKDIDRTYSVQEIQKELVFPNAEEALNFYKVVLVNVVLRTKVAFLSDLWKKIKASPEMTGVLAATEEGRKWLDIFNKTEAAFLSFTQPNLFLTTNRIRGVMEVNVLPSFGIGVKGRMPIFHVDRALLSYSDVTTVVAATKTVYNFGDLSKTTFGEDSKFLEEAMQAIDPKYRMGLAGWVIVVIAALAAIVLTYGIYKFTTPPEIPPEMKAILDKLKDVDPKKAADLLDQWMESTSLFSGVISVLKWLVLGIGVTMVGGTAIYFLTK